MAEPPLLNPPIDPSDPSPFGPNLFPDDDDLAGAELPLPPGFAADLPFDDDFDLSFDFSVDDFSVDDFLELPPEAEHPPIPNPNEGSGPGSGSGITSSGDPHSSDVSRNSCPPSPDSGHSATAAPTDSGRCSAAFPVTQEVKQEERNNWGLKRKKDEQDICTNSYPNRNPKPRGTKFRRSEEANSNSSCVFAAGGEEDEKRRARLMRNRESAQLSRQRKKHYVEELEDKVRALHSKINELNATVSYITAENISLKQQLGGGAGGNGPPSAVYPPAHPMGPVRFPWIPGYAMMPQGSHVPLVPIPRLKPQQPASAPKAKKPESKKSESKTKKVASISLLGFLFLVLLFGGVSPGVNLKYGGFGGGISGQPRGTVLNVSGRGNGLNGTDEFVLCGGNMGFGEGGTQRIPGRKCQTGTMGLEGKHAHNSSESLPAFLYVPRNGKHVKINGNLIIHSVLASEKAMAQKSARDQMRQSAGKEGKETSIAVAHNIASALAVSSAGREVDRHPNSYRKSEQQRALASSDSEDSYRDNLKASLTDGPLQQWFREGMTDPVLSSGICTEVFQFDASPASAHPGGIIPAASFFNATSVNATKEAPPAAQPRRIKNRRILYPEAIPLPGTTLNNSKPFGNPSESSNFRDNKSVSSMVVSVLADPREAGDGDGDARVSPKSFSRIFVVVLIDSVNKLRREHQFVDWYGDLPASLGISRPSEIVSLVCNIQNPQNSYRKTPWTSVPTQLSPYQPWKQYVPHCHFMGLFCSLVSLTRWWERVSWSVIAVKSFVQLRDLVILLMQFEDCTFEWLYWPQVRQRFSFETVDYIRSLDAEEDIALLKYHGWELSHACSCTLRISTMLLKKGVERGLTPYDIGSILCRETLKKESRIEEIIREVEDVVFPGTSENELLECVSEIMDRHLDELFL